MKNPTSKDVTVYMNEWTPEIGEILKTCSETKNVVDRFVVAVEKESQIVGLLNKGNSGRLFPTCEPLKYMSSWSSREEGKLRRWARGASTMYFSVLRRKKVYKNIEKQFAV